MVGTTKNIDLIDHGGGYPFIIKSSLSNIILTNRSSTEDIFVTIVLGLSTGTSELIKDLAIPPNVTLVLLDQMPLRVKAQKSQVRYTCASTTDHLLSVTYTSS
jgi:hypothetical protein